VLKKVKDLAPHLPVIMFTATGSEEIAVEAMKSGLEDYILKSPKHFGRLSASVSRILKRKRESEEASRRLELAHKEWEAIFQAVGQPAFVLDETFTVLEVNRITERVVGKSREELIGQKCHSFMHLMDEPPPACPLRALKELGLKVCPVSSQIVTRKIHADFVYQMASIAASLDKFATEIRNLQRTEIAEVAEPFGKGQVGSSAMPHKRNPMMCENICSLARLVISFVSVALLNQNTWHERDLANSGNERFILPYTAILVHHMIKRFTKVMENLNVYPEQMRKNLEKTGGLIYSSRVMLALANRGIPREDAHRLVQKITQEALQERKEFKALISQDSEIELVLTPEEIEQCFDPNWYLREIGGIYSRFPEFISEDLSKL